MNQKGMDLKTIAIVRKSMIETLSGSCAIEQTEAEGLYLRAYRLIPFDHAPITTNQVALLLHTFTAFPEFESWFLPRLQACRNETDVQLICKLAWKEP